VKDKESDNVVEVVESTLFWAEAVWLLIKLAYIWLMPHGDLFASVLVMLIAIRSFASVALFSVPKGIMQALSPGGNIWLWKIFFFFYIGGTIVACNWIAWFASHQLESAQKLALMLLVASALFWVMILFIAGSQEHPEIHRRKAIFLFVDVLVIFALCMMQQKPLTPDEKSLIGIVFAMSLVLETYTDYRDGVWFYIKRTYKVYTSPWTN